MVWVKENQTLMEMMDAIAKVPIIGLYIVFVPLLWCFAVNAFNYAYIAEDWLHRVLYCFFAFSETVCSLAMLYTLYIFFH